MTLFYGSQKAVSAACQEIADAAGASADSQMCNRALNSLNAAIQYLDGKAFWDFLLVEAPPINVVGPFTASIAAASAQVSCSATAGHGIQVDDYLIGELFAPGTRVTSTAAAGLGLNWAISTGFTAAAASTFTATAGRDTYSCPGDFRAEYTCRMISSNRTLRMLRRRMYDRSTVDEYANTNAPYYYDVFPVGASGKLRLLPPPNTNDVLQRRYYRHMATASTSATATTLDIPSPYESFLIAQAKWFFLTDKGEGRLQQAQTWMAFAQEGLKTMLRDNSQQPDEDLMMVPGHYAYSWNLGPNATRNVLDDPW